jgi:hypothetical protein
VERVATSGCERHDGFLTMASFMKRLTTPCRSWIYTFLMILAGFMIVGELVHPMVLEQG